MTAQPSSWRRSPALSSRHSARSRKSALTTCAGGSFFFSWRGRAATRASNGRRWRRSGRSIRTTTASASLSGALVSTHLNLPTGRKRHRMRRYQCHLGKGGYRPVPGIPSHGQPAPKCAETEHTRDGSSISSFTVPSLRCRLPRAARHKSLIGNSLESNKTGQSHCSRGEKVVN